mgnify:CR=1 FL=1
MPSSVRAHILGSSSAAVCRLVRGWPKPRMQHGSTRIQVLPVASAFDVEVLADSSCFCLSHFWLPVALCLASVEIKTPSVALSAPLMSVLSSKPSPRGVPVPSLLGWTR